LNLAVGASVLGDDSTLVFNWTDDVHGRVISDHLSSHGVKQVILSRNRGTGIATATRGTDGSVSYSFNEAAIRRTFRLNDEAGQAIACADVLVVTSFPFDDSESVDHVIDAHKHSHAILVIDPNPRPAMMRNRDSFRQGFERLASASTIVKVSDEDIAILYSSEQLPEKCAHHNIVLVTHGQKGATVETSGTRVHCASAPLPLPIVDTVGAGDATLASFVDSVATLGISHDAQGWQQILSRAMTIAAWTCRSPGGLVRTGPDDAEQ